MSQDQKKLNVNGVIKKGTKFVRRQLLVLMNIIKFVLKLLEKPGEIMKKDLF